MNPDYNATARQKACIARLARALGIREPIEEYPMSMGVAGKLINDMSFKLEMRRKYAKRKFPMSAMR